MRMANRFSFWVTLRGDCFIGSIAKKRIVISRIAPPRLHRHPSRGVGGIGRVKAPNAYGEKPFVNLDASKPNEAYFKHVDYIVDKAAALGLYIGMLPTWGDKVGQYTATIFQ